MEKKSFYVKLLGVLSTLSLMFAVVFLIGLVRGSSSIHLDEIYQMLPGVLRNKPAPWSPDELIIFQIRLPRLLLAAGVGAALAIAGVAFQGLLRNPLADPYIIGTSSGAALGAALSIVLGLNENILGISPVPLMAFAGSLVSMFLVYRISSRNGTIPMDTFLLAGVIVGSFMGALVSFLMTIAREDLSKIVFWVMGSFSGREDWKYIVILFPYLLCGSVVVFLCAHPLNLMTMGEEAASYKGVNVERTKIIIILAASLITAAAVSVSGLIGFVGLMIPHVVRMLIGPDHRILFPASAMAGAIFLMGADTLARTIIMPEEIPVGIITALCGAPFFFWLLKLRKIYV
jgi:iron complex transport system permease protein